MTIKESRERIGMSQQALSDWLGIPKRTLENWESGQRTPPIWAERLVLEKMEGWKNVMGKTHPYTYDFSDAMLPEGERPAYCRFSAKTDDKIVLDFYTNRALEGLFYRQPDGTFQQKKGTCDFSMPAKSGAIRAKMRRMIPYEK